MCLIISRQDGEANLPHYSIIEEATYYGNEDGIGVMYLDDGRVRVEKAVFTKQPKEWGIGGMGDDGIATKQGQFFKRFMHLDNVAFHLRYTTHGNTNSDNCHPFKILKKGETLNNGKKAPDDLYMMHNGILDVKEVLKTHSDTWHFAKHYLRPMLLANPELIHMEAFQDMLSSFAYGSKLVFMDSTGKQIIINEKDGLWHRGCWYSNTHYTPSLFPKSTKLGKSEDAFLNSNDLTEDEWEDFYESQYLDKRGYGYCAA